MSEKITEWTIRIRCKKFELGGNFFVLLFLVEVPRIPDDPNDWFLDPHCIGSLDAFVGEEGGDGHNNIISGFVHINDYILKQSPQHSLEPDDVVPFLKENLYWRILKVSSDHLLHFCMTPDLKLSFKPQQDGTSPEMSSLPSLEVMVMATPFTLPIGATYPEAGNPVFYPGITHGKAGGSHE